MSKWLDEIVQLMAVRHFRDISPYDEAFLRKAADTRMAGLRCGGLPEYASLLRNDDQEAEEFYGSLNIAHSEFFRNPLTFAFLEQVVLPGIIKEKGASAGSEIRIWSAACAAGQDAYSVAMLMADLAESLDYPVSYRIFATDRSSKELIAARKGFYEKEAVDQVRLKHLERYFCRDGERYSLRRSIRERVDFSLHDLLDERSISPPASIYGDFDLVLCSNVLFYYRPELRKTILDKVCRSLSDGGYLVTGQAEKGIVTKQAGLKPLQPSVCVFQKNVRR